MSNYRLATLLVTCLSLAMSSGTSVHADQSPSGQPGTSPRASRESTMETRAVAQSARQNDNTDTINEDTVDEEESSMKKLETITLGAGCFWCIEAVLDRIEGVESAVSGYMGGVVKNPSYQLVCTGTTGHAEVVQVQFDSQKLPIDKLLDVFWQVHDPTTLNQQGFDVGTQYRSAIFYHTEEQRQAAEESKKKWNATRKFRNKIVTEITAASEFYDAEDYHQEYFDKNRRNPYCRANILPKFKKLGLLKPTDLRP